MTVFKKIYSKENLICSTSLLKWRTKTIEQITKNNVFFEHTYTTLIRNSIKYPKEKSTNFSNTHYYKLAKFLDYCFSENIVHGDINRKNIILNNDDIFLIDWEPALFQVINNQTSLMVTNPWVDHEDKINRRLTVKTDLLCFYRLIKSVNYDFFNTIEWKRLQNSAINSKIPFTYLCKEIIKENLNV